MEYAPNSKRSLITGGRSMQSSFDPPFDFSHLVDVKPLLATATDGDLSLTIDSIERYEHGFVLVLWIEAAVGPMHLFTISARDDAGTNYAGCMEAGYGSGRVKTGWFNRVIYSFTPALDPVARPLTLTVKHTRRLQYHAPRTLVIEPGKFIGGPWQLTYDISRLPSTRGVAPVLSNQADYRSADPPSQKGFALPPSMATNSASKLSSGERPARFEPTQLRRIIPVARHQEVERFALTLLSLECYADGSMAVVRTDYPEPFMHLPTQFAWNAGDDQGGSYRARGASGSGSGGREQMTSWRIDCTFTPALDRNAHELRLWFEDAEFTNVAFGSTRPEKHVSIRGRWEFVIAL